MIHTKIITIQADSLYNLEELQHDFKEKFEKIGWSYSEESDLSIYKGIYAKALMFTFNTDQNKESPKEIVPQLYKYRVIESDDTDNFFEVEAKNLEDAAQMGLSEVGWYVQEVEEE